MSNLYEQIEAEEAQIKGEELPEKEVEIDAADEEVAEIEEEVDIEEIEEDEAKEEKEPEKEKEQQLDASAYAKLRREKRELQERIEALEAAKAPPVVVDTDAEPSKEDAYEEWLEWKDQQIEKKVAKLQEHHDKAERERQTNELWNGAIKEFQSFENAFQKKTPDYEAASEHMRTRLADAMSLTNPDATPQEINTKVSNYILQNAARAAQDGYDPAEYLYREAKNKFGFTKQAEATAPKKQVDLKRIDSNRKKSASPLQSGGQTSSNHVSLESIAGMSMAQFAKLSPSQLRELEAQ